MGREVDIHVRLHRAHTDSRTRRFHHLSTIDGIEPTTGIRCHQCADNYLFAAILHFMPEPLIFPKIELIARGISLSFASYEDVRNLFNAERRLYSPIFSENSENAIQALWSEINRFANHVEAVLNDINRILARPINEPNARSQAQTLLDQSVNQSLMPALRQLWGTGPLWLSTSPEAQFVFDVAKHRKPPIAAFAMLHLLGRDFDLHRADAKEGAFLAQLFRNNITDLHSTAERKALTELTSKWTSDATGMRDEWSSLATKSRAANEALSKDHADFQTQLAENRKAIEDLLKTQSEEAAKQRAEFKQQFEVLQTTYTEHMRLNAPVEYWREKKTRHLRERRRYFWTNLLAGAGGLVGMCIFIETVPDKSFAQTIPWRLLLEFFVLSSLGIWGMRILVRLYLSAVHLAEDAAEREVMALTYMALMRGDDSGTKYVVATDRALVLAALFRPSATGVIDDAAPPHASDILAKIAQK